MLPTLKCPVIALEEHYWDKELAALFVGAEGVRDPEMLKRLYDLGEVRLKEMDEAGIDVQILSHGAPSAQKLSGADAADVTRRVNDRLHPSSPRTRRGSRPSRRCRPAIRRRRTNSSAPPSSASRGR